MMDSKEYDRELIRRWEAHPMLKAEIELLKAENARYAGALRFLAGEGLTVARQALGVQSGCNDKSGEKPNEIK